MTTDQVKQEADETGWVRVEKESDDWRNEEGARLSGSQSFSVSQAQGVEPNPANVPTDQLAKVMLAEMDALTRSSLEEFEADVVNPARHAISRAIADVGRRFDHESSGIMLRIGDDRNAKTYETLAQLDREWRGLKWALELVNKHWSTP